MNVWSNLMVAKKNIKDLAMKYAVLNAAQHEGKAQAKAVLGKLISEDRNLKKDVKEVMGIINPVVDKVNKMNPGDLERELEKYELNPKKKNKESAGLPELEIGKKGKLVMRMAPYPSGPLHIGNARMVVLNDEYVKRYGGKLILVYDDTIGSKEKFVIREGYDLIKDGLDWLGVEYHKVEYKSERMKLFYEYAEKMIKEELAYVCLCDSDTLRKNRKDGVACEHRDQDREENIKLWKKMLDGKFKEGEASLRLKTDIQHPNPAFRDRVLLRIANREHPRVGKKFHVWPMLEFSWAVDDYELGMTHILRGKDLVMEDLMELYIWDKLKVPKNKIPKFLHYGMLKLEEAKLSKSKARAAIEAGVMTGWEDPRTWSLQSLRKRGIRPQAVRNFIIKMGMSLSDVSVPAEILYAENRKLIDSDAGRYFGVMDPIEIEVEGVKEGTNRKEIEAPVHPEYEERGKRIIPVNVNKIIIEKADYEKLKGKEVGLINLFSVKLGVKARYLTDEVNMETPKIHWVSEKTVEVEVVMPDGDRITALLEPEIERAKDGDIIQLMRIGFCRVERRGKDVVLYYAHK